MKKVSFCRMSYINTRSLVYESPNWIIFDVLLSNRIAQFGEILISLPQMRAFGVALFLSEQDLGPSKLFRELLFPLCICTYYICVFIELLCKIIFSIRRVHKLLLLSYIGAAAVAKSLQLCPTLCNPRDSSPPGFPIPGILQARTLEWVAIAFSIYWCRFT